ncbi:hypothetical protein [Nocardia sp. NPDC059195]
MGGHRFTATAAPKIPDLPDTVWINPPASNPVTDEESTTTAA